MPTASPLSATGPGRLCRMVYGWSRRGGPGNARSVRGCVRIARRATAVRVGGFAVGVGQHGEQLVGDLAGGVALLERATEDRLHAGRQTGVRRSNTVRQNCR